MIISSCFRLYLYHVKMFFNNNISLELNVKVYNNIVGLGINNSRMRAHYAGCFRTRRLNLEDGGGLTSRVTAVC